MNIYVKIPPWNRMNYTRVKVDGTVAMYWFIHVLINLPIGDCAMYFDHDVPAWRLGRPRRCVVGQLCPILISPIPSMYGIFTYIWLFLMVKYGFHLGKYTSPMDGKGVYPSHIWRSEAWENTQDVASIIEEMERLGYIPWVLQKCLGNYQFP